MIAPQDKRGDSAESVEETPHGHPCRDIGDWGNPEGLRKAQREPCDDQNGEVDEKVEMLNPLIQCHSEIFFCHGGPLLDLNAAGLRSFLTNR